MTVLYKRREQPAVPALEWDGDEDTLKHMQDLAGDLSHLLVAWNDPGGVQLTVLTQGTTFCRRGDWVLFTEDGPYVSRRAVFEKWYYSVEES